MKEVKYFRGERFEYDSEAKTLSFEIRKPFYDNYYGWRGDKRGFGINMEALEYALQRDARILVTWNKEIFETTAKEWLKMANNVRIKGVRILLLQIIHLKRQGFTNGQQLL